MTVERTIRLVCDGAGDRRKCEGASHTLAVTQATAAGLRSIMRATGWSRVGHRDFCAYCAAALAAERLPQIRDDVA